MTEQPRVPLRGWIVAALVSLALLTFAILGAGEKATLGPMRANESMPDGQATAIAANTARLWLRERDAGHVANFEELTCRGALRKDFEHARRHDAIPAEIAAVGRFTREGHEWKLDTSFADGHDVTWVFRIVDGGLQVCGLEVPNGLF